MSNWKLEIKEIFSDVDNTFSFKRVSTFICIILVAIAFLANLFFGLKIDQFIYESVVYIILAGLGIVGAEKFATKKKDSE